MKRRFYIQFIIVSLAIMAGMTMKSYAIQATVATQEGVNLVYVLNEESKDCSVVYIVNEQYSGQITIPSYIEYEGKLWNVTRIEAYTFKNCNLSSVIISEGVTSIGKEAFYGCKYLNSVSIPSSLTSVEEEAFYEC